jgi:hypothetical protein
MRLWKNGLIQLGLVLLLLFVVGLVGLGSPAANYRPSTSDTTTVEPSASPTIKNQSAWTSKHIANYTMTVQTSSPPVPSVDLQIVIRNGKIVDEKLLECEVGQPEYSAPTCKALKTYYYSPGGQYSNTMDDLFKIAESCTEYTKKEVTKCDVLMPVGFTGFTSSDELWDFQTNCGTKLTSIDALCSVQYDSEYSYPKEIFLSTPNALDGGSAIFVKNFHVDD